MGCMKGWIALDIDGTITHDRYSIPLPVVQYLGQVAGEGWRIIFITGRAFVFAKEALESLPFPFILSLQNGSITLDMPSKKILYKKYLKAEVIPQLAAACEGMKTDFLVYSGYENRDRCYFRPSHFTKDDLDYVEEIQAREKEKWIPVSHFEITHDIPLIKCFGKLDVMKKIKTRLHSLGHFQIALIRDPFRSSCYLLLITSASKGSALKEVLSSQGRGGLVIAAGDDENDISLLQEADIKIAMPHAPESVRKIADFIAPPTNEFGIIHALKIAVSSYESN